MQIRDRSFQDTAAGVRLVVRRSGADTGGEAVVVEVGLRPRSCRPRLHRHPHQQERIEVLAGSVVVQVGGRCTLLGAGGRVTIPPGAAHRVWASGGEAVQFLAELSPALDYEAYLAGWFALRAFGPARPLRAFALGVRYRRTVRPVFGRGRDR